MDINRAAGDTAGLRESKSDQGGGREQTAWPFHIVTIDGMPETRWSSGIGADSQTSQGGVGYTQERCFQALEKRDGKKFSNGFHIRSDMLDLAAQLS